MVRRPMADGFDRHAAPGRHTHRAAQPRPGLARPGRGRPAVRRMSAIALVMLVLQYGLGMILNFYVEVPAADAHAGIFTEIATAPLALTAHALLGVCLAGTAVLAVARAMALRDRTLAVLAAAGLAAIVGAFVAGEMFVKNGEDSTSFAMAMLTGAALLCYVTLLVLTGGIPGRRATQQETEPLLVSVPAAREAETYQDEWGAEPGWDDDPDWAGRLRQDQEPGWPQLPTRRPEPQVRQQRLNRAQPAGWEQRAPWDEAPPPGYRPGWRERPQGPNWRL